MALCKHALRWRNEVNTVPLAQLTHASSLAYLKHLVRDVTWALYMQQQHTAQLFPRAYVRHQVAVIRHTHPYS